MLEFRRHRRHATLLGSLGQLVAAATISSRRLEKSSHLSQTSAWLRRRGTLGVKATLAVLAVMLSTCAWVATSPAGAFAFGDLTERRHLLAQRLHHVGAIVLHVLVISEPADGQ